MTIIFSRVDILNCRFENNNATSIQTKGIFIGFSTVVLKTVTFFEDLPLVFDANSNNVQGTFLHVTTNSTVEISHSQFTNGLALQGGAIYVGGTATLTVLNTTFTKGQAYTYGGALYLSSFA